MGGVVVAGGAATCAMAPLERALTIGEAEPGDGLELADVRFALTKALWQTGERARAVVLATQARETFAKVGTARAAALAEATAWLDRHARAALYRSPANGQ
jgi:hypothetical protein